MSLNKIYVMDRNELPEILAEPYLGKNCFEFQIFPTFYMAWQKQPSTI